MFLVLRALCSSRTLQGLAEDVRTNETIAETLQYRLDTAVSISPSPQSNNLLSPQRTKIRKIITAETTT